MKICVDCFNEFEQRGQNHKRCDECALSAKLAQTRQWHKARVLGVGKGGNPNFAERNPQFKHGLCVFRRWAKERLRELDYRCERCGNEIEIRLRGTWAGHHKDHNREHNVRENLEVLCKRCHQIEHECWKALQGVTTIPEGSTQETVEAPSLKVNIS